MVPAAAPAGLLRHPHDREILRLAVPALGALVAEPLFLLADAAIVGHLGTPQLAGLGVASTVLQTVIFLCVFLAYGTTATVARQLGAGNVGAAVRQGVDGMWLAFLLGLGILASGILVAPLIVEAFGASPTATPHAVTYLRVSLLGAPGMLVVLAATGVLRGLQDTRTPLLVASAGAAVNVALNVLLVYGVGMGIAGSAAGTALTQTGMAAAFLTVVVHGARREGANLRPDWTGIRASASAGVPLIVRTLTLRVVLVVATAVATRLGDVPLAAHQVAFTVWMLLALTLDAIAIAGQAIVGRYLGAADVAGTRAATRRMLEWGIAVGTLIGLAVALTRPAIVPLFTEDPAVRELLSSVLLVAAAAQPLAGAVFVLDGVLIGAGDGRYLAVTGLWVMAVSVAVLWSVRPLGGGLVALWWAIVVFMATRMAALSARAAGDAWLVTGANRH